VDVTKHAPDLDLQYDVAEFIAGAHNLAELAPVLLQLLVGRLGLSAAELSIQSTGTPRSAPTSQWLVHDTSSAARSEHQTAPSEEGVGRPPGHTAAAPRTQHTWSPELCSSSDLPFRIDGDGSVLLRAFSRSTKPLDVPTQRFLRSVGQQIARFVETRVLAERCEIMNARQALLLDSSGEAAFTIDGHGRVLSVNTSAEVLCQLGLSSALGSDLVDLIIPSEQRQGVRTAIDNFRRDRGPTARVRRMETSVVRSDRTEFPAVLGLARLNSLGALSLTVLVTDVSQRDGQIQRLAVYRERLRSLTADLLLAEEHERRQLAVDLHDGLSQTIALIRMRLAALRQGASDEQAAALCDIEQLVQQADQAARSVSFELSPPVLHDFGLEPALEWLAQSISARYGLKVQFDHDDRPKPTDEKTRIILFRSIRELLINAAKHAKAHLVKVKLERVGDELLASVADDGVGMLPAVEQARGSGLFSIVERLHHVGGEMSIQSERGRGTSITLRALIADAAQLAPAPCSEGVARRDFPVLETNEGMRP